MGCLGKQVMDARSGQVRPCHVMAGRTGKTISFFFPFFLLVL